jgi:uncharacterized protein
MANTVAHFESNGPDMKALASFYTELFGWHAEEVPDVGYTLVDTHAGSGINGGFGSPPDAPPFQTFYVGVDDLQATLDRAAELGGKTLVSPTDMGMVAFALFADPDGITVGLVLNASASEEGAQGPSAGDGRPVDWFEVLGTDAEKTQGFYADLFGWKFRTDVDYSDYRVIDREASGTGIGGGIGAGDGTTWATCYARVPDVEAALARAEELGGNRVFGPKAFDENTTAGAFTDPAGNVFGVYS